MPAQTGKEIVLVTGGTNGIGLDTVIHFVSTSPKYHVIIGARNLSKGETVLKDIQSKPIQGTVSLIQLDVTDDTSISSATKKLEQDFPHLDVLINNAGVCPERDEQWPPNREYLRTIFETNVFGPTLLTTSLLPLLKKSPNPRVINVSSSMGSIAMKSDHSHEHAGVRFPGYRMSKAALNMLTAYQHYQLKPDGFKVWTFCPGYVVTDIADDRENRVQNGIESSETSAVALLEIVRGERDADVGGFIGRYGEKFEW
ncbi:hypothetical protein COCVIDRAFT_105645 [Bipolaris victoriae FI3]|uniref:Short chain dehydrogenase n=1 Tax=Bipolaris victoriae (strain FI3) TaxID=930091 RepID=W7E8X6_BIPV3|nr:hypothetical protein COCVIDRAFT_105645 [Bipolaris victoriae FI3]